MKWEMLVNKKILKKLFFSKDMKLKKIKEFEFNRQWGKYIQKVLIDNEEYYLVAGPFRVYDKNFHLLFEKQVHTGDDYLIGQKNNNEIFIKEHYNNIPYITKLIFYRNRTPNPYVIIILLIEIMLLLSYLLLKQYLKIPLQSATSSYFIVYSLLGKLYFWKLIGRMKEMKGIDKPHKKMYADDDFAVKFVDEYSDEKEPFQKGNFFLFRYKVFEIKKSDEFPIIQTISHDLKSKSLLAKLTIEKYIEKLEQKAKNLVDETLTIISEISEIAKKLSIFAQINKLKKKKVEIKSFLEPIIDQYINHPFYDKIELDFQDKIQQDDIYISIDEIHFKSAFENLLDNALQATDENGYIKIKIIQEKDNDVIEMRNQLSDPDIDIERFLEQGYSTKQSGSGLGVPIARTIIEKHGGTLELSKTEKEFVVKIILPTK